MSRTVPDPGAAVLPQCQPFRFDRGSIGLLLQHGFSGCPASMRPMGEWLAREGFSVIGPRWPGHGTSWRDLAEVTWRDWERASVAALFDLAGRCSTVVAVGLSAGGGMVLHLGATHPDVIRGVVAINALVRRPDLRLAPLASRIVRSVRGVGNDIKKPDQDEACYDRIPMRGAAELGRMLRTVDAELPRLPLPLLIFSSHEDHTVKPSNSRRIAERTAASPRKQLVPLANSYHVATLDNDAPMIFQRVADFARSLVQEAPSPKA